MSVNRDYQRLAESDYLRDKRRVAIAGLAAGFCGAVIMVLGGVLQATAQGLEPVYYLRLFAGGWLGQATIVGGVGVVLLGALTQLAFYSLLGALFSMILPPSLFAYGALGAGLIYGLCVWAIGTFTFTFDLHPRTWLMLHLLYGACLLVTPFFTQAAVVGTVHGFKEAA